MLRPGATSPDVIILGAGILGITLAWNLTRLGLVPLVIDPGAVAGGTTGASFAWANASTKTGDAAYHRLNAAGVAAYGQLCAEFGARALGISRTGALQVVRTSDAPGHAAMLRDLEILTGFGYPVSLLSPGELGALEPGLALPPDAEALHLPADLVVDAPHFTRFLAARMVEAGGSILHARPATLIADDTGRVSGVETDQGRHLAANVVLATGKDTGQVLADLTGHAPFARRFPLRQVPGLILTTPTLTGADLAHVLYTSTTDELHILPTGTGALRIGSDDVDALIWDDRSPEALHTAGAALLAHASRILPALAGLNPAACDLRIGIRPYPEDGKTIIGPLPGADGLMLMATHSGITLAPVLGRLLAGWISSGNRPEALAPFGLERFAGFQAG